MRYSLRPATENDIVDMYNISRAAHRLEAYGMFIPESGLERFRNYYRWSKRRRAAFARSMTGFIRQDGSIALVATRGKTIVGYTLAVHDAPDHVVLKGLFVRPQYQGQGVGRELFEASYRDTRPGTTVSLEVLARNTRARGLYEKQGFRAIGPASKRFFGASLITMVKLIH